MVPIGIFSPVLAPPCYNQGPGPPCLDAPEVLVRLPWSFFLPAFAVLALGALVPAAPAHADMQKLAQGDYQMSALPDEETPPWTRLGHGMAMLLPDEGSLFLNDNRVDDRIGYQALLGQIEAENRVRLSARLKVLSNFDGRGTVMEIARPGLQVALHLYPTRVELVERGADGRWRWLAAVSCDLFGSYHEVTLEKDSSEAIEGEMIRLWVDGVLIAERHPHADSSLEVGRLLIGSMSRPSMGASIWDWVRFDLDGLVKALPSSSISLGTLKAKFSSRP